MRCSLRAERFRTRIAGSPIRLGGAFGSSALAAALWLAAGLVAADPGVLLVAKPALEDPNFVRAVLVVAHDERGASLGVILNRPGDRSLAQLMGGDARFARFTEPLFLGGPVERAGLFAVFRASNAPGPALQIGEDLWLALMPETVERLLLDPPAQLRLYVGYAGWAPGQLAFEIERGAWWTLAPEAALAFREDTRNLWEELATRATTITARYRAAGGREARDQAAGASALWPTHVPAFVRASSAR